MHPSEVFALEVNSVTMDASWVPMANHLLLCQSSWPAMASMQRQRRRRRRKSVLYTDVVAKRD